MIATRYYVAALLAASCLGAVPAAAQCSGTTTCSTTNTASLTIGPIIDLGMSAITTTLTPPVAADLATGYVTDAGPTFTVSANQDWTLSIKASGLNPAFWTYTGTKSGAKAIGDLTWAPVVGGPYAAMTGSDVVLASSVVATTGTVVPLFFRTLYSASFAAVNNRAGVYSLPVVFTLSAP